MARRIIEWRFITMTAPNGVVTPLEDITSFSLNSTSQGAGPVNTISRGAGAKLQRKGVINHEITIETRLTDEYSPDWAALHRSQANFSLTWQESSAKSLSDGKKYTAQDCLVMSFETSNDAEGELTASIGITLRDVVEEL